MKSSIFVGAAMMAVFCAQTCRAEPTWLITPDEVQQDSAAAPKTERKSGVFRTRAIPTSAPEIAVTAPVSLGEPLKAPFPIRVAFKAKDGAAIKPESFRAYYGFLKVDITERLAGKAQVTADGISVENANIPSGSHKLTLRVTDDRDRQAETEIRFSVQ